MFLVPALFLFVMSYVTVTAFLRTSNRTPIPITQLRSEQP